MKKTVLILSVLLSTLSCAQKNNTTTEKTNVAALNPETMTDDQKVSYYLGMNVASSFKNQGLKIDPAIFNQAFNDEMSGAKKLLAPEGMNNFMMEFSKKMNEKKQAEQKASAEVNKKKGDEIIAKNKQNPAIKTTASGLQYEVLKAGEGKDHPKASDIVKVLYTGTLPDGTIFDSTANRDNQPAEFPLSGVIKGWTEGIQLMTKGAKYKFYIPAALGYGDNGAGGVIPPGSLLVFDVELLDFNSGNPPTTPPPPAQPAKAAPVKKAKK